MSKDPTKLLGLSLQVLPDALAGRVMVWKEMFALGQATCSPEPQLLKYQASQQATASLISFTVKHQNMFVL